MDIKVDWTERQQWEIQEHDNQCTIPAVIYSIELGPFTVIVKQAKKKER